jgi:hypothetical protein
MGRWKAAGVTVIGGAAVVGLLMMRRWQLGWGTTGQEAGVPLPGDGLIANPGLTATRGITIGAPAGQVWPWIAQLGQGRGGFYSYDFLENLVGCDIHSADRIGSEWQEVEAGDQVRLAPQVALGVALVERGKSLVLRGGVPVGNIPPRMTSPGPSCSTMRRAGRRGCWCGNDTHTRGRGPGPWSSPWRRSASS